jgi:hypothetical protein
VYNTVEEFFEITWSRRGGRMAAIVTTDTETDARILEQIHFDIEEGLCSLEDPRNTSHMQRTLARLKCRKGGFTEFSLQPPNICRARGREPSSLTTTR